MTFLGKINKAHRDLSKFYDKLNPDFDQKWSWQNQKLLLTAELLAASLENHIRSAKKSLDLEMYIFQDDTFGRRIETFLTEASKRGVSVRVCVDGIGSRGWINTIGARLASHGIEIKVYHQLAWERFFSRRSLTVGSKSLLALMKVINRRNHKKICVADGSRAWVSSSNIWDVCVPEIMGDKVWKEVGIEVEGEGVMIIQAAFNLIWHTTFQFKERKVAQLLVRQSPRSLVRLNNTIRLRMLAYHGLLQKIRAAKSRIWITTPYFVPPGLLITELSEAVKRKVDVSIMTSEKSDIAFMPWVSAYYQHTLTRKNVKIYAYFKSILHAKYVIVDDLAIIGSSNINSRSLHHDLEADILTQAPEILEELAQNFIADLKSCYHLRSEDFSKRPIWQKVLGKVLLLFRHYL